MIILGIETSCDETSAAIIEGQGSNVILKSSVIASSFALHTKTGGIIPENAAREQIKFILPVIEDALKKAFDTSDTFDTFATLNKIDAIALTYGPGLIGSLLVGVETAKTIGYVLNKPIIPVNHMVGHIYANFISANSKLNARRYMLDAKIEFPAIALVVSGGHTDLLLMTGHGIFTLLGGTRDDAAGEAFDKIARLIGLPYPGGPAIEKKAKKGNPKRFRFPRPLVGSTDLDFSFSGLKTAVLRKVQELNRSQSLKNIKPDPQTVRDLAFATQDAIVDVLIKKTLKAAVKYNVRSILISGGVAANQSLRNELKVKSEKLKVKIFAPQKSLCTDNAAMIAACGFYNYHPVSWREISADPELYFSQ